MDKTYLNVRSKLLLLANTNVKTVYENVFVLWTRVAAVVVMVGVLNKVGVGSFIVMIWNTLRGQTSLKRKIFISFKFLWQANRKRVFVKI